MSAPILKNDASEGQSMCYGFTSSVCKSGHLFCQSSNQPKQYKNCPICQGEISKRFEMCIKSSGGNPFHNLAQITEAQLPLVPMFISIPDDASKLTPIVPPAQEEAAGVEYGANCNRDSSEDMFNRNIFIRNIENRPANYIGDAVNNTDPLNISEISKQDWDTQRIVRDLQEKCGIYRHEKSEDGTSILWENVLRNLERPQYIPRVIPPECTQIFNDSCDKMVTKDKAGVETILKAKKYVNKLETLTEDTESANQMGHASNVPPKSFRDSSTLTTDSPFLTATQSSIVNDYSKILEFLQFQRMKELEKSLCSETKTNDTNQQQSLSVTNTSQILPAEKRVETPQRSETVSIDRPVRIPSLRMIKDALVRAKTLEVVESPDIHAEQAKEHREKFKTSAVRASHLHLTNDDTDTEMPKFKYIPPPPKILECLVEPKVEPQLSYTSFPVHCPISSCKEMCFVTQVARHIQLSHNKIPIRTAYPGQPVSFFFDPKTSSQESNKCMMMFLLGEKVKNIDTGPFKDFIPVLVMSTRVYMEEMVSTPIGQDDINEKANEYIMIWVTGMDYGLPIYFSLSAWAAATKTSVAKNIVMSSRMLSLRESQTKKETYKKTTLLLSPISVKLLTCNDQHMINLQLTLH